jgi:hypothetical protein
LFVWSVFAPKLIYQLFYFALEFPLILILNLVINYFLIGTNSKTSNIILRTF